MKINIAEQLNNFKKYYGFEQEKVTIERILNNLNNEKYKLVSTEIRKIYKNEIKFELIRIAYEFYPKNIHFVVTYGSTLLSKNEIERIEQVIKEYKIQNDDWKNNIEFKSLEASVNRAKEKYDLAISQFKDIYNELNNNLNIITDKNDPREVNKLQINLGKTIEHIASCYLLKGNCDEVIILLNNRKLTKKGAKLLASAYSIKGELYKAKEVLEPFKNNEDITNIYVEIINNIQTVEQGAINPKNKKKVFISYRHNPNDMKFVDQLIDKLKSEKIEFIIDKKSLNYGDNLIKFIGESVEEAICTIFIVSKDSLASEWITIELIETLEQEKSKNRIKLIPIFIDKEFLNHNFQNKIINKAKKEMDSIIIEINNLSKTYTPIDNLASSYKRWIHVIQNIDKILKRLNESVVGNFSCEEKINENIPKLINLINELEK